MASAKQAVEVRPTRRATGGRPTRDAARQRDRRVMAVATELFLERGFAETTLEEIARRAAVAKRTLYSHYHDKGAIFAAVVRARVAEAMVVEFECDTSRMTLEETLAELAREVVDICTAPETVELNRVMIAEAQRFPDLIGGISDDGHRDLLARVAETLERLAIEGRLALSGNPPAEAARFCDMMVGLSALHAAFGLRWTIPDRDEIGRRVAQFIAFRPAAAARRS